MTEKTIYALESVYREPLEIKAFCFGDMSQKTICIMGAMRGNEVQQMYVCARLVKELKKLEINGQITKNTGIMVIPCANYHSMNIGKRFWAMDNTDINRMFPGYDLGETTQRIADGIFSEIQGFDYGIQLASFYQPGQFLTHVKQMVTEFTSDDGLTDFGLPYALKRTPRPYDTTTLNYNWQIWNTKAYSLFTHSTDDMKEDSADNAVNAILRFMKNRGIINYPIHPGYVTSVISESDMIQVHSPCGGICRVKTKIGDAVDRGQVIAEILDPLTCEILAEIKAPEKSTVFFHFASPLIVEGTVIFKLIKNNNF
ncbi:MAG: succinylglutamate desuccinylase/aspartoacylase family protein [Ruminococcus sp.]|nr:succinylglutamate desuccinylase/aspartoacylase family protein [Ruminococcus sp.]